MPKYKEESEKLAKKLNLSGFEFVCEDASNTSFDENTFDTVIMNDAMEHISKPEETLTEMYRILRPGGRLYVNFPPYNHPYGAHLSDAIGIPWVHLFFSDKTLIMAYKELVSIKPNKDELIEFRISADECGNEYFSYINKMTLKRFKLITQRCPFHLNYHREVPLRKFLAPFCRGPLREYFVKMVVCVFEK